MSEDALLADCAAPGVFTDLAAFASLPEAAPDDVGAVVRLVQGLLIHEGLTGVYGVALGPERAAEKQLHGAAAILGRAVALDSRPLTEVRPPERRVVGVCRHFATLFVAIMRHKGVPARARCGFAGYFAPGKHLDHWVGEYWNAAERRWVLVDARSTRRNGGISSSTSIRWTCRAMHSWSAAMRGARVAPGPIR